MVITVITRMDIVMAVAAIKRMAARRRAPRLVQCPLRQRHSPRPHSTWTRPRVPPPLASPLSIPTRIGST
jgi:hypothetical protein